MKGFIEGDVLRRRNQLLAHLILQVNKKTRKLRL
jgi:hypothetical protein